MKYRKFGKLAWEASALGFGIMRLPVTDGNSANIDEAEATRMVRYAIDNGVNYLDTAYPYHSGQSEAFVGRVLKDGYRKKVRIATKLPVRSVQSAQDFDRYLNEQLERLQTNIDFYLFHDLSRWGWQRMKEYGILKWAEEKMAEGKFANLGFSFHDDYDAFKEIIDDYDNWTLAQIQYNYMDINFQAGQRGLEYAAGKGLAVVIMEPLRGGRLTKEAPGNIKQIWKTASQERTLADWGLSWVWNHPEISVVLSGMSTMEQITENLDIADRVGVNTLTPDDIATIAKVRAAYNGLSPVPCTGCEYCLPCPNGVAIPGIFTLYNDALIYDNPNQSQVRYRNVDFIKKENRADQCLECGECIEACPQKIPIPEFLEKAHTLLKEL
ncbi:aldo/keto reductase [Chloroflexota bacterium]